MVWVMTGSSAVYAQDDQMKVSIEMKQVDAEVKKALQEASRDLNKLTKINTEIRFSEDQSTPKLGLYITNLDFEDVYERHYPMNYGVLVTGVVKGGNADRAGLIKNDIIMEFDGEIVRFEDHLLSLRDSHSVGDTVNIKFFRNEKVMQTRLVFAQAKPTPGTDVEGVEIKEKEKLSVGFGGGGPRATMILWDLPTLNTFLTSNGFKDLRPEQYVLAGGYGMGNIGSGWFIGGEGAGFLNDQKFPLRDAAGNMLGYRTAKIEVGYGGVTLTKKIPLFTERLVLDFSSTLGGGSMAVTMGETDGNYSWGDTIGTMNSNFVRFKKDFLVFRPSAGLLIRIKNWVGVHGGVGYMATYATTDDWTEAETEFTVTGDSPTLNGALSYNIGVWFGF